MTFYITMVLVLSNVQAENNGTVKDKVYVLVFTIGDHIGRERIIVRCRSIYDIRSYRN